ncbi:MAG: hypothetical protein JJU11_12775, partial [Candidatus Sumerlaeia bacterium]|nr:hypothetical protein [Candidatus Sumerlaeia bacterium]
MRISKMYPDTIAPRGVVSSISPLSSFLFTLMVLAIPSMGITQEGQSLELLYSTKANLTTPNPLVAADIVHTPDPELIITDVRGRLRVFSAATGEEIRSLRFNHPDDLALTAPAVGDFTGDNALEVAIGTQDGEIIVFKGSDMSVIAREHIGTDFSLQPTVVTLPPDEDGVVRERMFFFDDGSEGNIHAVDLVGETLSVAWTYPSRSRLNSPLSIGMVREAGRLDLVGSTADGYVLLLDPFEYIPNQRTHDKVLVSQGTQIPYTPLTWMENGANRETVVVTLANGEVLSMRYNRVPRPTLERNWSVPTRSQPVSAPVLLSDGRGTPYIIQATHGNVAFIEAESGSMAVRTEDIDGANTPFALLPQSRSFPLLGFSLRRTIQLTEPYDSWLRSGGHGSLRLKSGEL